MAALFAFLVYENKTLIIIQQVNSILVDYLSIKKVVVLRFVAPYRERTKLACAHANPK